MQCCSHADCGSIGLAQIPRRIEQDGWVCAALPLHDVSLLLLSVSCTAQGSGLRCRARCQRGVLHGWSGQRNAPWRARQPSAGCC